MKKRRKVKKKKMDKPKITFYGGVGTATGANIGLEFRETKILVDCGLLQGLREVELENLKPFSYNPSCFDFLFVTHAHMDHIGKVPKLVKEGFRGKIISTEATRELALPMLMDAIKVMQSRFPERLYEEKDVENALSLWEDYDYGREIEAGDCRVNFSNAGHILGSAMVNIFCGEMKFTFTGDLGNSPSPLLPDVDPVLECNCLVMESVYGDRNHEDKKERDDKFREIIKEAIKRGGEIVIPTFSLERTQVILFKLNNLVESGQIQSIPVFLDSPLGSKVTEIYKKYSHQFKNEVKKQMEKDDIFDFPNLFITKNVLESNAIDEIKGPKIILAGSGMSEGGRVINHESRILGHPENTLLLVGYQPVGTLGRKLEEGNKEIEIFKNGNLSVGEVRKEKIKVKAKIEKIEGFSSHMDSDHLLEFVSLAQKNLPDGKKLKIFCIMGEIKSSLFLVQRIRDYLGAEAIYPEIGKEYKL